MYCINSQRNQLMSPHDRGMKYNSSDVPVRSSKEATEPYGECRGLPENLCLKSPLYRDTIKKEEPYSSTVMRTELTTSMYTLNNPYCTMYNPYCTLNNDYCCWTTIRWTMTIDYHNLWRVLSCLLIWYIINCVCVFCQLDPSCLIENMNSVFLFPSFLFSFAFLFHTCFLFTLLFSHFFVLPTFHSSFPLSLPFLSLSFSLDMMDSFISNYLLPFILLI